MTRRSCFLLILLLASGPACDGGCEGGVEEATSGGTPTGVEEPVTEDGYEVVLANPGRPTKRSNDGDEGRRREQEHLVREPTQPDPHGGTFTLEEAVEGMPIDGPLVAEINSGLGTMFCDLFADRVPNTVANFIGLARGKRAFWDARAGAWVNRRAYDRTSFHRVIPEFGIQGGDPLGDGTGTTGYTIAYEPHESLRHDRAGQLCMASAGPEIDTPQFFITDGRVPRLDGGYTIFGQCHPATTIERIARVPQSGQPDNAPLTPVEIVRVLVRRVAGGAEQARITPPRLPEGYDPSAPHGASAGPSEMRHQLEERRQLREEQEQE